MPEVQHVAIVPVLAPSTLDPVEIPEIIPVIPYNKPEKYI
jgi:hypothetical protein